MCLRACFERVGLRADSQGCLGEDSLPFSEGIYAAVAEPGIAEEEATSTEADLPWNVVAHNDPINKMNYVTMVFQKVFGFPKEKAEVHMLEVHYKGRSIVWSGARERAELYVQQLHGYQLLATLEKSV